MDYKTLLGDKYESETATKIICRCPNPEHLDSNASAWINKRTGKGKCAKCGDLGKVFQTEDSNDIPLPEGTVTKKYTRPDNTVLAAFNEKDYYYDEAGNIWFLRRSRRNVIIGHGCRLSAELAAKKGRRFEAHGSPGFRIFAPILCESLRDAIRLIEAGFDAGSINGVGNFKLADFETTRIFVPQNDTPGIMCASKMASLGVRSLYWWREPYSLGAGAKDIRDMSDIDFDQLCTILVEKGLSQT